MHDFDELLRTCRHRRLKRWIVLGVAVMTLVVIVGLLQWYLNHRDIIVEKPTVRKQYPVATSAPRSLLTASKTEKVQKSVKMEKVRQKDTKTAPVGRYRPTSTQLPGNTSVTSSSTTSLQKGVKYRVLQFAVSLKKHRKALQNLQRRLERFGLHCYIKSSIDGIHLYLRCYKPENFSSLIPTLKKLHYSYFHVSEEGVKKPKPYRVALSVRSEEAVESKKPKESTPQFKKSAQTENVPLPSQSDTFVRMKKSERVKLKVQKVENLDTLKARFERYPSYETALRIAKILYGRKKYAEAAAWARKANALNRDKEGAWILFAKAEYAMGEKEKAKRILRIFLDYKSSKTAQALLGEWSRP